MDKRVILFELGQELFSREAILNWGHVARSRLEAVRHGLQPLHRRDPPHLGPAKLNPKERRRHFFGSMPAAAALSPIAPAMIWIIRLIMVLDMFPPLYCHLRLPLGER